MNKDWMSHLVRTLQGGSHPGRSGRTGATPRWGKMGGRGGAQIHPDYARVDDRDGRMLMKHVDAKETGEGTSVVAPSQTLSLCPASAFKHQVTRCRRCAELGNQRHLSLDGDSKGHSALLLLLVAIPGAQRRQAGPSLAVLTSDLRPRREALGLRALSCGHSSSHFVPLLRDGSRHEALPVCAREGLPTGTAHCRPRFDSEVASR